MSQSQENLPAELELALAHSPEHMRDVLRIFFELDSRLARIVSGTNEPMLGQMRLAWWRETLAKPAAERPAGDAVIDAIGALGQGYETGFSRLIDGWEHMLVEPPLTKDHARAFAEGRVDALCAVFVEITNPKVAEALERAAWHWAVADLAAKVSDSEERSMLVSVGLECSDADKRLPKAARGIAVLGALGLRSLKAGGRPLMEGRGAALTALRAAIFGR